MTSKKQITANRMNSSKSTGPTSVEGKNAASRNAIRHGILSNSLFLPDEDPQAFQQLFEELTASYQPSGVLEMILIEKIAVSIWKQRRVVAAETAAITLHSQTPQLMKSVNAALNNYRNECTFEDLRPADAGDLAWSENIVNEWEKLDQGEDVELSLDDIKSSAPFCWRNLQAHAATEGKSVNEYLSVRGISPYTWIKKVKDLAELILKKDAQQQKYVKLYHAATAELSILPDKPRASFERYQATLDNQLYRAIKELRQLQDRRLSVIETIPAMTDTKHTE